MAAQSATRLAVASRKSDRRQSPCSRPRRSVILVKAAGALFCGKDFVASGPPACPDRLDKFVWQPFGSHLGGETFVIIDKANEVYAKTIGVTLITQRANFEIFI